MQYHMLKLHLSMPVSERLSRISGGMPVFVSKTTVQGGRELILWYKQKVSKSNCCFAMKFTILIYSEYTWTDTWDRSVYFPHMKLFETQWKNHCL